VVVDFSGCPGDSVHATAPNWVTCPWPPDYLKVLDWQWNEVVAPYWIEHAKFAADHGVKIAIEMHPGFVVYSPETMLRLRSIAGPSVGCNFDPSHLFWQSIDPDRSRPRAEGCDLPRSRQGHADLRRKPAAHRRARYQAVHRRARTQLDLPHLRLRSRRGVVERVYLDAAHVWLRSVLSIEHEDSLLSPEEGLTKAANFLNSIVIREQPGAAWWV
jgi:sugar phosphate isomerase/epimerase